MRALILRVALVGGGLALGLVLCEVLVRLGAGYPLLPLVPPEPYVDNEILYREAPTRGYELRPGIDQTVGAAPVRIQVNAGGFRDDRDYPLAKPSGTVRIVVLGDSFTFGGKVPLAATFPRILGEMLGHADPARRYEVLNMAVPGYNTVQELSLLRDRGLAYQPDLVLVSFVLNDAIPGWQPLAKKGNLPLGLRKVMKRSYLVQFVYARVKQAQAGREGKHFKTGPALVAGLEAGRPEWDAARAALAGIKAAAEERGARTLVAVWPMFEGMPGRYPFDAQHRLVTDACADLGIPALDLLPTFASGEAARFWVAPYDHHPNGLAQRMAAERLFGALQGEQKALLAPPATPAPHP